MDSAARSLVTDAVEPVVNLLAGEITRQCVPVFYAGKADQIVVTADTSDRTRDRCAHPPPIAVSCSCCRRSFPCGRSPRTAIGE